MIAPNQHDLWVLLAMALYFIVVLAVGFFYIKRSNADSDSYFIGGRGLGPWLTALSAEASDMSGWLLMGLPGVAYFTGASDAVWTAVGLAVGTYLNWRFVARPLRKYSEVAGNSITLPDYFSNRFHDSRKVLMSTAAVIILVFFSVYAGSCFVTFGKLFTTLFGVDYTTMMVIGALVVFAYTFIGGYLSVCTTDLIQGAIMVVALVVVFVGSVAMAGGVENTVAFLSSIPGFLSGTTTASPVLDENGVQKVVDGMPQFGDAVVYGAGAISIVSGLSWGLGYFGMPQVLVRFMSARHSDEIKKSRVIATVWCVVSLACAVCIGLVGRAAMPDALLTGAQAENIFVLLAQTMLPAFLCGLVVSGIFAATMSSSSSYLLIAGSAIARNLFKGVIKKDATDQQTMFVARLALTLILLFGILIALDQNSSIFKVVSYAWAGFGASFGPLVLLSLYWRRTNAAGAFAGMVGGGCTVVLWNLLLSPLGGIFGIYELVPGFIVATVAIVAVSLLTAPPSEDVVHEFDTYMDADV
ncbi:sodium/proline symporter [Slackia exigua]|uniref:sodium/proline symporter n=1 Tax=Slackia exigua TaxID=84109 RepID=UPI003BA1A436